MTYLQTYVNIFSHHKYKKEKAPIKVPFPRIAAIDCTPHSAFYKGCRNRLMQISSSLHNYNMILQKSQHHLLGCNHCQKTLSVHLEETKCNFLI